MVLVELSRFFKNLQTASPHNAGNPLPLPFLVGAKPLPILQLRSAVSSIDLTIALIVHSPANLSLIGTKWYKKVDNVDFNFSSLEEFTK